MEKNKKYLRISILKEVVDDFGGENLDNIRHILNKTLAEQFVENISNNAITVVPDDKNYVVHYDINYTFFEGQKLENNIQEAFKKIDKQFNELDADIIKKMIMEIYQS